MTDILSTTYRTLPAGGVRVVHEGAHVRLVGWVHRLGGKNFAEQGVDRQMAADRSDVLVLPQLQGEESLDGYRITRLDQVFEIYSEEQDAIDKF